ncbi:MAG: class A beta-lactamase [Ignavibacteriales bacterium]
MTRLPVLLLTLLALVACKPPDRTTAGIAPPMDMKLLDQDIGYIAKKARPAAFDVAVLNIDGGESWSLMGDRTFPMQSVFKAPLAAAVLAAVDRRELSLDEPITIADKDLSPPYSPIAAAWPAIRTYTVRDLLVQTVEVSDNTAADVLMRRIGGPGMVQAWLDEHGIKDMRIDRYEREIQVECWGMPTFRPEWRTDAAFNAAKFAVPPPARHAALVNYLTDQRDTSTTTAALDFLRKLENGELLSPASTQLLLRLMTETKTGETRIKAGLPPDATFAHKTGTGGTDQGVNAATNDMGVITLKNGHRYAVAVFLAGSTLPGQDRDALFAAVGRAVTRAVK